MEHDGKKLGGDAAFFFVLKGIPLVQLCDVVVLRACNKAVRKLEAVAGKSVRQTTYMPEASNNLQLGTSDLISAKHACHSSENMAAHHDAAQ